MPTPSRTQRGGFSLCVTPAHRHTVRRRGRFIAPAFQL